MLKVRRMPDKFICLGLVFNFALLVGRVVHGDDKVAREERTSEYPVLSGIGVALSFTEAGPQVGMVLPGSAAEKSGKLRPGDRLLSIRNGESTVDLKGKRQGEVVSLIRGPVGSMVTLEVLSASSGSSSLVTLKREAVPLQGRPQTYADLIGRPLPAVTFSALGHSSKVPLSGYAGKVIVIDFWASWCGTCYAPVDKMQEIARVHPEWTDRVALLTATIDTDLRAASKVVEARNWKETTHLSLSPEELEAIKIVTVPAVIILSPEGKVAAVGDPHSIAIETEVSKLLSQPATDRHKKP